MNPPTARFVSDTAERMVRTFIQAYLAAWLAAPLLGGDTQWDTLFTAENLKYAVVATFLALATAIGAKGFNNPDSASALPTPTPAAVAVQADPPPPAAVQPPSPPLMPPQQPVPVGPQTFPPPHPNDAPPTA